MPADLDVHLILDNYGTHKTALIRRWLAKRPRFHLHFTPTGASWLNLVERWFALLTDKQFAAACTAAPASWRRPFERYLVLTTRTQALRLDQDRRRILESVARFCRRTSGSGH